MVVNHLLKWMETARVSQRAAAAGALARAYIGSELAFEDRCAAEAALTLILDDPSAKVRGALADALSMSRHAPPQVVAALAGDQPEVAALVIARSPLLTDADLIDRVATGRADIQRLIASRPVVTMAVSAAIAEAGAAEACVALATNRAAEIASVSFRRMAERLGHVAELREALIADPRLPSDCRHTLLVKLGEALRNAPLVVAMMGEMRAERLTREACARAAVTLIDGTPAGEYSALVEHLRLRGDLTEALVVRATAHGKVDFLGAALVSLSGQGDGRVRALLASGQDVALAALFARAGLDAAVGRAILRALKVWRAVANGRRVAGAQEVSRQMLEELGPDGQASTLAALLKSIHLDALRENARGHARAIAAA